MTRTVDDLVSAAVAEWERWGNSVSNEVTGEIKMGHTDDEPLWAKFVIDNYCAIVGDQPTALQIADDEYFWSAVGITAIFKSAGFPKTAFPYSASHSTWIRAFIKARKTGTDALYWGYRLHEAEATPMVGDLIAYTYETKTFEQAQVYFDRTSRYGSHSDIVVARRPGEIDVIGANVLDSVTRKTMEIDDSGRLANRKHHWFAVLRRKNF